MALSNGTYILRYVRGAVFKNIRSKIRGAIKSLLEESRIMIAVDLFRDTIWPGGKLAPPDPPRTREDKLYSRSEANRKLSTLVPGKLILYTYIY